MRDNEFPQLKRNWKGLTWDYDVILAQEELSSTFHCLTATTRMLLLSMLQTIEWPTRYKGTDIDKNLLEAWAANAAYELGGAMLRQNPVNFCQLQASCDGVTWTTIFDYSMCDAITTPSESLAYNAELEANAATYDDDISNLTDAWDYDGTYSDADTNNALCWAIEQYIIMTCDAQIDAISKKNEEKNFLQDLSTLFGLGAATVGFLVAVGVFVSSAATGGAALALAAVLLALTGEYDDSDPALFADSETREEIRCDIYAAMDGLKPTFANWQAALSIESGEVVNNYVYETMQSEDLFMQFLLLTSGLVSVVGDTDFVNDCLDCPEPAWIATADMEVAILPALLSVEAGNGMFIAQQGIVGQCYTDGSDRTIAGIRVNAAFTMSKIDFYYNLTNCGGAPPGVTQAGLEGLFNVGKDYELLREENFGGLQTGFSVFGVTVDRDVNDLIQAFIRSCYFNCGGSIKLRKVVIRGTGINPFDGETGWVIT